MIDRRAFVQAAMLTALSAPLAAGAAGRAHGIPRVGVLGEDSPVPWTVRTAAAEIECRFTGDRRRLAGMAADLCARGVDVLVTLGATSTRAAIGVTRATPIIFVTGGDPVADGLVASLAQPGGTVTGLIAPAAPDGLREGVSMLARMMPGLQRVAVLSSAEIPAPARLLRGEAAPIEPGVELSSVTARDAEDVAPALRAARRQGATGLAVWPDALFAIHARRVVEAAAEARLPAVYGARAFAEAGGLIAVYTDTAELIRRTAALASRVLAGERPGAIAVERLGGPRIAVHLGAARALGLSVPRALIARAEAVFRA